MAFPLEKSLPTFFDRARDLSQKWPLNRVQFSIRTGWAETYEDIFACRFRQVLDEEKILDSVLNRGRAILAGRGGDGKTWLLRRLYMQVLERGDMPLFLDLKQWTGADYEVWKQWTSNEVGDGADFLVRRFCGLDFGAIELDRVSPVVRKVLLVDGLNEITSPVGAQILRVLDELVRNQIHLSLVVADRLIRRELPNPARWSIGTPLPLSEEQVRAYLGSNSQVDEILRCPFFLDAATRFHVEGSGRSQASKRFLVQHSGLAEAQLDRVAVAAFDAYRRFKSRIFDRAEFVGTAGEEPTRALELSDTLLSNADGTSYFVHHILHDYLAARQVASWPTEEWTSQTLTVLSFDSSSFDAVELVFEQLGGEKADLFLRRLYDWNLYAAGYALAQTQDANASTSAEMRTMIFAMLAEKRFDSILATRERANDALALMQLSDAKPFRDALSLGEIFRALNAIQSNEAWFNDWKGLFETESHSRLSIETLSSIRSLDSISGWTIANVAKRSIFQEGAPDALIGWLQGEANATIRWRIAHTLGACPTPAALDALLGLLDNDPDPYVRYGAIRSITEVAALANGELRQVILDAVAARADAISKQPKILGELRASLLMDAIMVPAEWLGFVRSIVRAMFVATDNTSERDLWRQCLNRAEELYGIRADAANQADGSTRRPNG
jgi:hypothetical protein